MIEDAPWYMLNTVMGRHIQAPTVREEIRPYISQNSADLGAHQLT
jgi:hypothetical protein